MWLVVAVLLLVIGVPLSASANTVTLTWNANTEDDLAGYRIYRDSLACSQEGPKPLLAEVGPGTSYVDTTVPNDWAIASYRITAFDTSDNESSRSLCVEKSFSSSAQLIAPPNFLYSVTGANITIHWDAVTDASNYLLRVHKYGTPYDPCESMVFCGPVVGTSKDLTLEYGAEYDLWVYAKDAGGITGPSSGQSITMPPSGTPPEDLVSPKNFRYSVSGTTITLQWDSVSLASDYFLTVHKYGTPYDPCASMVFCGALFSTFQSFTLDPGEIYDFSVYARKADGTAGPASVTSVTMPAAVQDPMPRTQPLDFHILQLIDPLRLSVEPLASAGCVSITVTVVEKVATVLCVK